MGSLSETINEYMKVRNKQIKEATEQLLGLTGINMKRVEKNHVEYIKRYLTRKKYELYYKENDTQIDVVLKHKGEVKAVRIIIKKLKLYKEE